MNELFIPNKYVRIGRTDKANCVEHGVRLYRSSPDAASLQIRSSTEKQGIYATVSLSAADCRALAAKLNEIAETI